MECAKILLWRGERSYGMMGHYDLTEATQMKLPIPLIAKFTFAASFILLMFMGVLDNINLKNFRKVMIDYAASNAEKIADVIGQSTYDAMMKNDRTSLNSMIGRIADSDNIEYIRLLDQKGTVVFSSRAGEVGSVIGRYAHSCSRCHPFTELNHSTHQSRILVSESGKESLGFTRAIRNEAACSNAACHFHAAQDAVLGHLDVSISLEMLRKKSHEYRLEFVMLTCLLLLIIGLLITILTHYLVDIPLQKLVGHTLQVATGNLESRVTITSSDELGELSEAINRMTENLGTADRELKEWAESLEQKVAERSQEVERMQEQLRRSEKLASLGTLSAGVAHEINNPLTGILLYASILGSDTRLDPALLPDLDKIRSETQRCAGIVKDLLEFSRESLPAKEQVAITAILDEVAAFFHHHPDFNSILITKRYGQELPLVSVDPNQLRQVCMNLVINAGHAMPHGGSLEITTAQSADRQSISISFKDTGTGIPEEHLTRIFDPFFTTKAEGTGLGLSISYGIISNNGGNICVQSEVGKGTTFVISLPVVC